MFSEKMAEQGDVKGLEEGEGELLCFECGADFRSRHYFLRHIRAHKKSRNVWDSYGGGRLGGNGR